MSKAASQYLREVKKRIRCSHSLKTEFLYQLEAEVIYYCEDHNDVDFATLSKYFGKPEDVAKDFLSELGESAAVEASSNKQKLIYFLITIVSIVVVGLAIHISYLQHALLDVQYIESITYEGELSPGATSEAYKSEYYYSEEEIQNTE